MSGALDVSSGSGTFRQTLSHGQKSLWFLESDADIAGAYNVPFIIHMRGPLDFAAIHWACSAIVHRHPILASHISDSPDPKWMEATGFEVQLENPEALETDLPQRVAECAHRPFRLANEVPIRFDLAKLSGDHYALLSVTHHIAR